MPFVDGAFSAVVIMWVSADVDDFAVVLRDAFRVLQPGGLLVSMACTYASTDL